MAFGLVGLVFGRVLRELWFGSVRSGEISEGAGLLSRGKMDRRGTSWLGGQGVQRAGGRDDRGQREAGRATPMRMTKVGAAGIGRYGRETSGGEGRHRQRATSAYLEWEENDNGEA